MKRNRIVTLIAGMVLSTTLAVSSPLTAFGTDFFDNAGAGDTETYEDSMYVGADEFSEEDYSDEDYSEDDYSGESDGLGEDEQPAIVYTVTYDMNGHGESYTEDVEEGFSAVGPEDLPMDDGYEFLGWFTDKKCQTPWDGVVTSNMTVYAGWEEIPQEPEEQEAPAEEPEVIETPQQTEEAGGGETEATEEAAGAAGQEEGAGGAGTGEQTAQTENGNTAPSENTAGAGTTAQEIAEEGDGEKVSEEAANAEDGSAIIKTQPEEVKVVYSDKAEFKLELKDDVDSSKVTYQWYKDEEQIEGANKNTYAIESVKKVDDGSSYHCELSDGEKTYESNHVDLTVLDLIKTSPESVTVPASGEAKFTVEIEKVQEPSAVKYAWKGTDPANKAVDLQGNKSAETSELVISPAQKYAECEFYCEVTYKDNPPESSEPADLTVQDSLDKTVEYPAGVSFSVPYSDSATYHWYIHDKSTGKNDLLDGISAEKSTLIIPSTTKDDDGQKFYCEITEGGKTVKSEQATLKISNKNENKPVLYVGNYAIDLSKEETQSEDGDVTNTLYINDTTIALLDDEQKNAVSNHDQNFIEFDHESKTITFNNVHLINTNAIYDHNHSPAVGIYLSGTGDTKYKINLVGDNKISLTKLESIRDDKGSAIRINSGDSKKKSEVEIEGEGTLTTRSGKTSIVSDGKLVFSGITAWINQKEGDKVFNGIESDSLTLNQKSKLFIGNAKDKNGNSVPANGTCIYVHDDFKMASGSQAELYAKTAKGAVKDAVVYAGKEFTIDGAKTTLKVNAKTGDDSNVKQFSGIETAGTMTVSGGSEVNLTEDNKTPGINTPGTVYGIKATGAFSLKDSKITLWAQSSDRKGKAFGVLCGSSKISLSEEKTYLSQCLATKGVAFAALTGKDEKKAYQENYTPKQIKFETAEVVKPHECVISTASIKDGSKDTYVETIYEKGKTTVPAEQVNFDSNKTHTWGDIVYEWKADNSAVTAQQVCQNYNWHVKELETAKTTKKTIAPTCTADGKIIYTAVFKNSNYKVKPKEVKSGKALGHKFGEWVIITRPTLTATGEKKHTCERCKKVETAVIPKLTKGTYKVEKGASLEWTKGSGKSLEVKVIRETENKTAFSHFQGILVDGKVLKKDYYKAKSGSVVITFKKDFLSKLAVGTHTLTYGFEDGDNPTSKLVIKSATSNSNSKTSSGTSGKGTTSAKTGDTTNIFLWVLTLCAAGAAVFLIQRYKRNNKNKDQDEDTGSDSTKK